MNRVKAFFSERLLISGRERLAKVHLYSEAKPRGCGAERSATSVRRLPSQAYWSSSENNNNNARTQRFSDGTQNNNNKNDTNPLIRCVRSGSLPLSHSLWS